MIPGMAAVQYESKENMGRKFWTAHYSRYAIWIDAKRRGVYPSLITLQGGSVRKGGRPQPCRGCSGSERRPS